jgi:hypothetical protein
MKKQVNAQQRPSTVVALHLHIQQHGGHQMVSADPRASMRRPARCGSGQNGSGSRYSDSIICKDHLIAQK